jgi:AcrR family transcriptional regulator
MERRDARHNRDELLTAARAIFEEQGTEASLREVARRAGVGIGTLYRHFPTREALLEALLGDGFDTLNATAEKLLTEDDSLTALTAWLREMAIGSTRYEGLPSSVLTALHDPASSLHTSCEGLQRAVAALLARAQHDGHIRADLTPDELLATVNAMAWATKQSPLSLDRGLQLLITGLHAR